MHVPLILSSVCVSSKGCLCACVCHCVYTPIWMTYVLLVHAYMSPSGLAVSVHSAYASGTKYISLSAVTVHF